jgi:tetratricopeptide (TPR) repeat protein
MTVLFKSASSFLMLFPILVAGLVAPAPLAAQPAGSFSDPVQGVVRQENGGSLAGLRVELSGTGGSGRAWSDVRPDGSFRIPAETQPGKQYILRVFDGRGQLIHDDIVRPDVSPLEIHLHGPAPERPVSGVVSVEELRNPVPEKAMREYRRARKAAEKGNFQRAIQHLHKAIEIHPGFVEAHNSLGVKHMRLRDFSKAAEAFETALRLKPQAVEPLSNLGIAYHGLERYEEAERLIRTALELNPRAPRTRFSLALVLLSRGNQQEAPEALRILLDVAEEIPQAHLCLATFYEGQAQYQVATREVTAYLDTQDPLYRELAQQWLVKLESAVKDSRTARVD